MNTGHHQPPQPDVDEIEHALRLFVQPGGFGEIRSIGNGPTQGFYFNHRHIPEAAQMASEQSWTAKGIYVVMNPIGDAIRDRPKMTWLFELTENAHISRRGWTLIDADPVRKPGLSSTDEEKKAAWYVLDEVGEYLRSMGFAESIMADSGNGFHLLVKTDLPNDDESARLIQAFLNSLFRRFSTAVVKIDTGVHNSGRITKAYGTVARKGDGTADRPYRVSKIIYRPDGEIPPATRELFQKVIDENAEPEALQRKGNLSHIPQRNGSQHWNESSDFDTTCEALRELSPDLDYQSWLAVLMACHSVDSSESMLRVAIDWCRGFTRGTFNESEVRSKWKSFTSSGRGVGIGTLVKMAKEARPNWVPSCHQRRGGNPQHDSEDWQNPFRDDAAEPMASGERQDQGTQLLTKALQHAQRTIEEGRPVDQVILHLRSRLNSIDGVPESKPLETLTSRELAEGIYDLEYLIPGLLVKGQPCILAGPKKCLKTNISIDLTLSLARQSPFLGVFPVNKPVRVALISGESGKATIQETAVRIAKSKSSPHLSDYENAFWCFTLPKLGQPNSVKTMVDYVELHRLDVLVIDPAYLAMPLGDSASNLFLVGAMLGELTKVSEATGVTIILCHHARKGSGDRQFDPPELESIAWAGFQEWARQWILLGRRDAYNPDSNGEHELWLTSGGSAGHSGLWAVDIEEGTRNGGASRKWVVEVKKPYEARQQEQEAKEQIRDDKERQHQEANREKVLGAYRLFPNGETSRTIRESAGLSGTKFNPINADLIRTGTIEVCTVTKAKGSYEGFRLAAAQDGGTTGTRWDSPTKSHLSHVGQEDGGTASPLIGDALSHHLSPSQEEFADITELEF
jgi:hypothetical protein